MGAKKVLKQYSGPLTTAQASTGIQAALENARSLLSDAELLLSNERWPRAAALAILAVEEAGKIPLIRAILMDAKGDELSGSWKAYRTHTKKNTLSILPELVAKGARRLDDFKSLYDETSEHPQLLDAVKQIALYTDACGVCHWSSPKAVIAPDFAKSLVRLAELLVGQSSHPFSTAAELDIWVKHMKSVWRGSLKTMKKALLECYEEARRRGLLQGENPQAEIQDFLLPGASVTQN